LKRPLLVASLSLQFLLERAALTALGYWGSTTGAGTLAHVALAIFGSAAAALVIADQAVLGAIFAATVTVNVVLLHTLGEGDVAPSWRPA
jgi:hypothetical protein